MLNFLIILFIMNAASMFYFIQKICDEELIEGGLQVKHILYFTVFLPALLTVYIVMGLVYVGLYIADPIKNILNKKIF